MSPDATARSPWWPMTDRGIPSRAAQMLTRSRPGLMVEAEAGLGLSIGRIGGDHRRHAGLRSEPGRRRAGLAGRGALCRATTVRMRGSSFADCPRHERNRFRLRIDRRRPARRRPQPSAGCWAARHRAGGNGGVRRDERAGCRRDRDCGEAWPCSGVTPLNATTVTWWPSARRQGSGHTGRLEWAQIRRGLRAGGIYRPA